MHRIFIAYDGSPGAEQACRLVAGLAWPAETTVQVVTAIPTERELRRGFGHLLLAAAHEAHARLCAEADAALDAPRQLLAGAGLDVETLVVGGRPPQALSAAARRFGATLVVAGSRGLGPVASTVLGSVSAELVDIAPAPVLIARTDTVGRVVLGADGSEHALAAEAVLEALPMGDASLRVVSVADVIAPWRIGIAPTMHVEAYRAQAEYEAEARRSAQRMAEESAGRLSEAGLQASAEARAGDPGWEIVGAADALDADLVVVGSRGTTGLRRFVLGSVARKVVHHARASVLVVRSGTYEPEADDVREFADTEETALV